jgi:hypothetical protein
VRLLYTPFGSVMQSLGTEALTGAFEKLPASGTPTRLGPRL